MRTLVTGQMTAIASHNIPRGERGFTLVELMVVIAIIGLLAGVVVVNLPPPRANTERDIERTAARFRLAADLSILSGRVTGVEITRDRYRLLSRVRGAWVIEEGPDRGFAFPEDVDEIGRAHV